MQSRRRTNNADLLARAGLVDEVVQQDDLLVARQPPRLHRARRLLQRDLLVVAVDRLLHIHLQAHQYSLCCAALVDGHWHIYCKAMRVEDRLRKQCAVTLCLAESQSVP